MLAATLSPGQMFTCHSVRIQALEGGGAQETTAVTNASFECRLTGRSDQSSYQGSTVWLPCDDATAFRGLKDGDYTFWARISGHADSLDASVAGSNFTVDTSSPVLTVRLPLRPASKKSCIRATA